MQRAFDPALRARLTIARWLVLATRDPRAFALAVGRGVDGATTARAEREGVLGLLEAAAVEARSDALGPLADVELDAAMRALHGESMALATEALLAVLERDGVRCAPLKGPLTAERSYRWPMHRRSLDIDLLVDADALDAAERSLRREGYRRLEGALAEVGRHDHHDVVLVHDDRPTVELHFYANVNFGAPIAATPLLDRASICTTRRGARALMLALDDEWVVLSVHAAAHRFERLSWLYDVYAAGLARPHLADDATERARSLGAFAPFAAALDEASRWFGPAPWRPLACPPHARAALALHRALPLDQGADEASLSWLAFALALAPTPRARARLLSRKLLHDLPARLSLSPGARPCTPRATRG